MSEASFNIRAMTEHGEQILTCTGDNTELYYHSEQYKEVDHIFNRISDQDRRLGAFVWRHILGEDEFNRISVYMFESGAYPLHYRPMPTDSDFEQYTHDVSGDIPTWLDGNPE